MNARSYFLDLNHGSSKKASFAQKLEQKGRQEGIQKGIEQGLAQGRKETTLALARQLLLNGVERQVIKRATGLSDQVLDAIEK